MAQKYTVVVVDSLVFVCSFPIISILFQFSKIFITPLIFYAIKAIEKLSRNSKKHWAKASKLVSWVNEIFAGLFKKKDVNE